MSNHFSAANAFLRSKNFNKAIDLYEKCIKENPNFSYYYENIAIAYFEIGEYKKAKEMMVGALEKSSKSSKKIIKKHNYVFKELKLDLVDKIENVNLPSRDIEKKLWSGFSTYALLGLYNCFGKDNVKNKDKARVAFTLTRWHLVNNQWGKAIECINKIKKYDISLYRSKKLKLLWIESLIALEEYDKAKGLIDYVLDGKLDSDFICALSNLINESEKSNENFDEMRIDQLNKIYTGNDISPLSLLDENKGFVFGNIGCSVLHNVEESEFKISVLMPVYQAEEFIELSINSMLNQTWQNLEIIAVEDCSSDRSWEILEELAAKDSRLKIYRNERNRGAYTTRNRALSLASGDFITVHDSDDWSHPQMLEKQMEVMLNDKSIKITCSYMTRVTPDFKFILRPQRGNLEYVHRSYPSLLIRSEDIKSLGEWDAVSANADDEFIQRARILWGEDSIVDIMQNIPFSFFLVHDNSLTQQAGTSLNSLTFGIRHEYSRQAKFWRENNKDKPLSYTRTSKKYPFPIPHGLAPKHWEKNIHYDLILISDLSLLGGTRRCNEGYIKAAEALGWKVGLFHWPRYDLKTAEIADEYTKLSYNENIDFLVPEDEVTAKLVIIHHPPILNFEIDAVPSITCNKLGILVNQSPMQLWSQEPSYYDSNEVTALCKKLFNVSPLWIPISPRVIETLNKSGIVDNVYEDTWFPPYNHELDNTSISLPLEFGTNRKIIVGRHSRDHWTKWPKDKNEIKQAYLADKSDINVLLMGGVQTPKKQIGKLPKNWQAIDFDAISVTEFISKLDFFIHYTHEDYIEEFGRNIMEAMALGKVVILPPEFEEIFGNSAVYAKPNEVYQTIQEMWQNPNLYLKQAEQGHNFVKQNCTLDVVKNNLLRIIE
ncbi:glycosyltransferase [Psychrobacter sp. 1U1]|uniref:glycosyltransferase n=3 Tax=unclassified Psychrobacter TaxID=196806 RepID=UPI003F44D2AB